MGEGKHTGKRPVADVARWPDVVSRETAQALEARAQQAEVARDELLGACSRIVAWLDRLAEASDRGAQDKRFITLAEAHAADAKNYRATAKDVRAAIAKVLGQEHSTGEKEG